MGLENVKIFQQLQFLIFFSFPKQIYNIVSDLITCFHFNQSKYKRRILYLYKYLNMEKLYRISIWKSLIFCLPTFLLQVQSQAMLGSLNITVPGDITTLGNLLVGSIICINLSWNTSDALTIVIAKDGAAIFTKSQTLKPLIYNHSVVNQGSYTIRIMTSTVAPIPYNLTVESGGNTYLSDTKAVSYNYQKYIHKFNIGWQCNQAVIFSSSSSLYTYFNSFRPSELSTIANVDIGCFSAPYAPYIRMSSNQIGTWYFIPANNVYASTVYTVQTSGTIYARCLDYCGDSILQTGQQCDNGNVSGCIDCFASPSYSCGGNQSLIQCPCKNSSLIFNYTTLQCNINCALILNSVNLIDGSINQCLCINKYFFNQTNLSCDLNCSAIAYSTGSVIGSTSSCLCQSFFFFNSNSTQCQLICSGISHALYLTPGQVNSCICSSPYIFNSNTLLCQIDCQIAVNNIECPSPFIPFIYQNWIFQIISLILSLPFNKILSIRYLYIFFQDLWLYYYGDEKYEGTLEAAFQADVEIQLLKKDFLDKLFGWQKYKYFLPISNHEPYTKKRFIEIQGASSVLIDCYFCYFVYTIPSNIITVLFFCLVFKILRKYVISKFFRKYCFIVQILTQTLLEGNIVYISFVCFSHLQNSWALKFADKAALLGTIVLFFFVCIFTLTYYFLVGLLRSRASYFIYNFYRCHHSYIFLTTKNLLRNILRGAIFFYLHSYYPWKLLCLGSIEALIVFIGIGIHLSRQIFISNLIFCLELCYQLLFLLFNLTLYFQYFCEQIGAAEVKKQVILVWQKFMMIILVFLVLMLMILDLVPLQFFKRSRNGQKFLREIIQKKESEQKNIGKIKVRQKLQKMIKIQQFKEGSKKIRMIVTKKKPPIHEKEKETIQPEFYQS